MINDCYCVVVSFVEPAKLLEERNILRNINVLNYLVANLL